MKNTMRNDEHAGAVGSAAISVTSIFFIAIIIIALTANPVSIGTDVGQRAPDIEGKAYNGSSGSHLISTATLIWNGKKVI